ncbi:MAG: YbgC/FadM family acyl-CoA thioesterase [Candidatus Omnitrophica bacterium]|nr:YbgC/FadM family acyl-CoA thioesterase [Candidatus Omnitrophota bacterium]
MEKRIYYHDTDAGGVVYYGRYLSFLEESRTELLDSTGLTVKALNDRGYLFAVRKCTITYKAPARYGDRIICDAKVLKMTAAQLIFDQTIHNKETGQLLVHAEVALVCLSLDFKPQELPEDLRSKI